MAFKKKGKCMGSGGNGMMPFIKKGVKYSSSFIKGKGSQKGYGSPKMNMKKKM